MSIAIRVEKLGKSYSINADAASESSTLRDAMQGGINRLFGRAPAEKVLTEAELEHKRSIRPKSFWALRDVSFDVMEGERIGVIGANGAGKSTLLKILSRITMPTEGRVETYGKVASLLEVGTGFHPDLTGRENMYLSGAILGMPRREVRRKFDEIVDFAGVDKFIDTPVKHYSSGMYVRLAFAVSSSLDPDILIVDEVLAVGDAAFQKKCSERIKELTREGRTVLFVSHSMATVGQMCSKALYLENGEVVSFGPVQQASADYQNTILREQEEAVMGRYEDEEDLTETTIDTEVLDEEAGAASEEIAQQQNLAVSTDTVAEPIKKRPRNWKWHRSRFKGSNPAVETLTDHPGLIDCLDGQLVAEKSGTVDVVPMHESVRLTVRIRINTDLGCDLAPSANFYDQYGSIFHVALGSEKISGKAGVRTISCDLPAFFLNEGRYSVNFNFCDHGAEKHVYLTVLDACRFEIREMEYKDPRRHGFNSPLPGLLRHHLNWTLGEN